MPTTTTQTSFRIREIEARDSAAVADVIRTVMTECGATFEGASIYDPEVSNMFAAYSHREGCVFYVLEEEKGDAAARVVGCGGIAPLGGAINVCELRKLYFLPTARGMGQGRKLLEMCLERARTMNYERCYIETLQSMEAAGHLYQKLGFRRTCSRLGDTGHHCDTQYVLNL